MNKANTPGRRTILFVVITIAFLALAGAGLAVIISFAVRGMQRPVLPQVVDPGVAHLDTVLGLDKIDGIEEEGFSYVETSKNWGGDQFRWTLGHAKLVVPLKDPPQFLHVRLGQPAPKTVALRIQLNGKVLCDEKVAMKGDWTRTFEVWDMNLGKQATIEIISDTFVPALINKNNTDARTLGVCVRGITLSSDTQDFVDVVLGAQPKVGVNEDGFYYQEKVGNQPCRWTNGKATLEAPIRGKTPKSLALVLHVPNRPDFKLQVTVNGKKLYDDQPKASDNWTTRLPLDGVELGKRAKIEITSSTFVPAEVAKNTDDRRTLGVRVKQVMLSTEPAN